MTQSELACPSLGAGTAPDLTWLLHRAAQRLRGLLDEVAREHGLAGVRDWIVLTAVDAEPGRTQLALGQALGVDKTTLTSLLDRLETAGLVVREQDQRDRRARIPVTTRAGRAVQRKVAKGRDVAEASLPFTHAEHLALHDLLGRLAGHEEGGPGGSCM